MAENEKKDDLVEGAKRIGGKVHKLSKEAVVGIAAGIAVVVGGAWGKAMDALFTLLFSPKSTLLALSGYALFVTIAAMLAGRWAKKQEDPPASPG